MSARALLVEDDELVGTMVRINLEAEGFEVVWVKDGKTALSTLAEERFAILLLDIGLPELEGTEVLAALRARQDATPVLMLTARSDLATKVEALDVGADDYLTKPFDVAELVARVRALVRRSERQT